LESTQSELATTKSSELAMRTMLDKAAVSDHAITDVSLRKENDALKAALEELKEQSLKLRTEKLEVMSASKELENSLLKELQRH
jgi:TRAP-type mannitol/chloroaromatic compound transport system substrate-binding protein